MMISIHVECYAGHRAEETPRAVTVGERRIEVAEVVDRWLAPDHRYFKLRDNAGDIYIVRHEPAADRWELTMFRSLKL